VNGLSVCAPKESEWVKRVCAKEGKSEIACSLAMLMLHAQRFRGSQALIYATLSHFKILAWYCMDHYVFSVELMKNRKICDAGLNIAIEFLAPLKKPLKNQRI
jgi:hypothetical protein